ncbi:hypothetical protein V5P93_002552 [Actinokineospora auranticolor]|uniref:Uncharacterized protein n=1 Tax=Actinokineospora auranticolor TaxID=155976 RepID=A0A2S6GMF7_9PSEU|nr:hypothetical protein [Actinokineospora auranticolor]PPK66418.1 hypothetical protein CLV40_110122 [Actinokineospora auranticolor]
MRELPKFPPRPAEPAPAPAVIVSTLPDELPWSAKAPRGAVEAPFEPPFQPFAVTQVIEPPVEPEPAPAARPRARLLALVLAKARPRWLLPAAGAVVAAVVAGLVLVLTSGDEQPPPPAPVPVQGEFLFQRMGETVEPLRDSDCAAHAYGKVKQFLVENQCRQLSRAVFITPMDDGRTVYTSVSVVRMPDRAAAEKLELLVRSDDTGSVNDLLREKRVVVPGLARLSRGGFSAMSLDRDVIIAESDTASPDPDPEIHKQEMKRISVDALRLGKDFN